MRTTAVVAQRADYTFKFNIRQGRHGWLRLTPAYSVKLVEEILRTLEPGASVVDPFSGTATTPLCAAYHGFPAAGLELNPFLVWFAKVKTDHYWAADIREAAAAGEELTKDLKTSKGSESPPPPIHNIHRWWGPDELRFLRRLKAWIDNNTAGESKTRRLLLVSFCRLLIRLSNAAFNHQSMSFKEPEAGARQLRLIADEPDYTSLFLGELREVLTGARNNPTPHPEIVQGDARDVRALAGRRFAALITSPPYPNRISYIRELRPYMYWLGYLTRGRDAGELDWEAVGGTWGCATSRLGEWSPTFEGFYPSYLVSLLREIARAGEKNGQLLSNYVAKYFEDMWRHLSSVRGILSPGAVVHYIIGNSTFYQVLVPAERVYADMLHELGFTNVEVRTIRKRNSKKSLYEFDVSAIWTGNDG